MKHSSLGASKAVRWQACPGSVSLSEKAPQPDTNEFAEKGTAVHSFIEFCLLNGEDPSHHLDKEFNGFKMTEEDVASASLVLKTVNSITSDLGGVVRCEVRFDLSSIHPGMFGTADVVISRPGSHLIVIDYKNGTQPVEIFENQQALYYGLGALLENEKESRSEFKTVTLMVIQPRAPHRDGLVRSWKTTPSYLRSWGVELKKAALATQEENAPLVTGDHCTYCPAMGICPKQKEVLDVAVGVSLEKSSKLPKAVELSDRHIANILKHKTQIENFLEEVKKLALKRAQDGDLIDGLKVVAGRGRRVWKKESEAKDFLEGQLGEKAYEKKLLSVAKAEKLAGKKELADMWVNIPGAETIAHESDRRKAIVSKHEKLIIKEVKEK